MADDFLLLNPGPVPVTDTVRRAMDEASIDDALEGRNAETGARR